MISFDNLPSVFNVVFGQAKLSYHSLFPPNSSNEGGLDGNRARPIMRPLTDMEGLVQRDSERLLVSRRRAAELLGCSIATVIRLEKSGILLRVRLNKNAPSGKAYYRLGDIMGLVQAGARDLSAA